jgi:hypothetical protein
VCLQTIADFNKVKQMTTDINVIIEALSTSTKLELNEEKNKIRRTTPFDPNNLPDTSDRTLLVVFCVPDAFKALVITMIQSGFPHRSEALVDSLVQLFSQFGKVVIVKLALCPRRKRVRSVIGLYVLSNMLLLSENSLCRIRNC